MFEVCDLVIINKIDVLPYFNFDVEKCKKDILRRNPKADIILVSALTGEGIQELADWFKNKLQEER